jgi:hypothetical protein
VTRYLSYSPPRPAKCAAGWALPLHYPNDTWIEPGALSYPYGGSYRRFRGFCPDGVARIGRCSLTTGIFGLVARVKHRGVWVSGTICDTSLGVEFKPDPLGEHGDIWAP